MVASEVEDVAALNWAWFGFEAFIEELERLIEMWDLPKRMHVHQT